MNPDIEKILLAQAGREAEQVPRLGDVVALGAGTGAALGAALGTPVNAIQGMFGKRPMLKPGPRMAGGLVGLIVGGGLGAFAQQQAMRETGEAGALLAKIQAQGGMTSEDERMLEGVLRDAYTQQGLLG